METKKEFFKEIDGSMFNCVETWMLDLENDVEVLVYRKNTLATKANSENATKAEVIIFLDEKIARLDADYAAQKKVFTDNKAELTAK